MYYWITKVHKTSKIIKIRKIPVILSFVFLFNCTTISQIRDYNPILKWGSWALLQAIPSPTYFEDRINEKSRLKFGLEWQIIPLSYSFQVNKYISNFSYFYLKPVKRFTGSAEVFFQPSLIIGNYRYSNQKKFTYKTGVRLVLPVAQNGEYMALSAGVGYFSQKTENGTLRDGITYEAGIYTLSGMLGLKFNYNQNGLTRYSFGLYFKYY